MRLAIECVCGNSIMLQASPKKYLQLRDCLETAQFHYDGAEVNGEIVKEFRISCKKCKEWITLGVD